MHEETWQAAFKRLSEPSPCGVPMHERATCEDDGTCVRCQDIKKARAEVLAAFLAKINAFIAGCQRVAWDKRPLTVGEIKEYWEGVRKQFQEIQPAASDLEELLDKAHEAGAFIAGEQLLKSLTEGGEFAVGSPLAKAKERVEELLRQAELRGLKLGSDRTFDYGAAPSPAALRIAELEKARASLEKP